MPIVCRFGGGGNLKAFAAISATYPEGWVCTCTDGSKVLWAKNTTGQALFLIPYAATWTVSCTDGIDVISAEVLIETKWQSVDIELLRDNYFIYDGGLVGANSLYSPSLVYTFEDGYVQFKTHSSVSSHGDGRAYSSDSIDLSEYVTAHFDMEATSTRSGTYDYVIFGLSTSQSGLPGVSKKFSGIGNSTPVARQTVDLDISNLDSGYFAVNINDNTGTVSLKIYNVWFE